MANNTIFGRTSGGDYLPVRVNTSGEVLTSSGTAAGGTAPVTVTGGTITSLQGTVTTNIQAGGTALATIVPADGDALGTALRVSSVGRAYNGTSVDIVRSNLEGTALASASRTATTNSADITSHNARGILVFLNVTVASGTGGLSIRIAGKDPVSGNYSLINATPTAITAISNNFPPSYLLYPGVATAVGNVAQVTSGILPRTFRIQVTHGDSSSYTYSVGYSLIN